MKSVDDDALKLFKLAQAVNRRAKAAETEQDRQHYYNIKNELMEEIIEHRPDLLSVFEVEKGIVGVTFSLNGFCEGLHIPFTDIKSIKAMTSLALLIRQKNWPVHHYSN